MDLLDWKRSLAVFVPDRYNGHVGLGIDDKTRASKVVKGIDGKRLTYRPRPSEAAHA
jgi:hypothetical protein